MTHRRDFLSKITLGAAALAALDADELRELKGAFGNGDWRERWERAVGESAWRER